MKYCAYEKEFLKAGIKVKIINSSRAFFAIFFLRKIISKIIANNGQNYLISNINESNNYKLTATDNESGSNISREFNVVIKPSVSYENIPYDNLYDGLNFTENSFSYSLVNGSKRAGLR